MSATRCRFQSADSDLEHRRSQWHALLDLLDGLEIAVTSAREVLEQPQRNQVGEQIHDIRAILLDARPRC